MEEFKMYLLAILLPPIAVLMTGKPLQALLNLVLWCFGFIPAIIHAILVVKEKKNKDMFLKQCEMMKHKLHDRY